MRWRNEAVQLQKEVTFLHDEVQWRGARIRNLEEQLAAVHAQLVITQVILQALTVHNTVLTTHLHMQAQPPIEASPPTTEERRRALTTWADVAYRWIPEPGPHAGGIGP